MIRDKEKLLKSAMDILNSNRKNGFTIPTDRLYPFQWNWDSGFICLGLNHYNIDAAMTEIKSLLKGQWDNGMVPHIIFHNQNESSYFPNWDYWQTEVNSGAPTQPKTSGITQPPVLGFILEEILLKHHENSNVKSFVKDVFPKIVNFHRFWYKYRDPKKEGLVFIYHPWESGRDNSPLWDDALKMINLEKVNLPHYVRRDTTIADASERPTTAQYDRFVYLMMLGKKYRYDGKEIAKECEFLIQDTLINAVLIKSNESLINIGKKYGFDIGEILEWQQQSITAYRNKLWSNKLSTYSGYDLRQEKQLPFREIGGLTSLYAGIPSSEKSLLLNDYLITLHKKDFLICPSFDVDHPLFDSKRYWRGPIWPQMNWLIYKGLARYGFNETANIVRNDLIELVSRCGFHEYFEAQRSILETNNQGYGGNNFSWTASTIIDLINS